MLANWWDKTHVFDAFHGTDEDSAIGIQSEGFNIPIELRDNHWLGDGVYFYRDDYSQAMVWGRIKAKRTGFKAAVLGVKIQVHNKRFLNLDTRDGALTLSKFIENTILELEENGIGLAFDGKKDDQCRHLIFGLISRDEFPVVQRTFKTDSYLNNLPEFQSMDIYLHGCQICVRDLAVITDGPQLLALEEVQFLTKPQRKSPKLL